MMSLAAAIIGVLVLCPSVLATAPGNHNGYTRTVSYADEIVVRCPDRTKATVQVLMKHSDVLHMGQENVDLRIKRHNYMSVQRYFPECDVVIKDFEAHMQEAEAQMFPQERVDEEVWMQAVIDQVNDLEGNEKLSQAWEIARLKSVTWFEEYHDYEATKSWYRNLARDHRDLVRYNASIGKSVEGRDMPAVHVTANHNSGRKKIYFQCQIHAREWISGATCMYVANHLVTKYDRDPLVTTLLNNLEFVIIPFANPDGYVYTWTHDRMWRKNRRPTIHPHCFGVDINRNFPTGWILSGHDVRGIQCAEDYSGPYPLSEPETQHIVNYFRQNAPIIGVIDWHSYGELILRPWGYTNHTSPDDTRLRTLSQEMREKIKRVHHKYYTAETSFQLYQCFGIGTDWFYSEDAAGRNGGYRAAPYCIELRGTETDGYGFVLPANQILPTGQEVVPAALHFAKSMMEDPIVYNGRVTHRPPDEHT